MRIFGLIIERSKGRQVGRIESAIIDLQSRVDKLEARRKVQIAEKEHESVMQSEIGKVLSGNGQKGETNMWSGL